MYIYGYDPTYFLMVIACIVALVAQLKVKSTFARYSKERSRTGLTGAEVAERILHSQGVYDVAIHPVKGELTDHYNPSNKTVNLSEAVYSSTSVAALGVAAHECGHAIQHAQGYAPLRFRSALAPVASIGSKLSWFFIIAGLFFSASHTLITVGIFMFSLAVLFQVVTLPVEFNASSRAVALLAQNGILYDDEIRGTKKVLGAAALTYVAAAATAIIQLIRLIIIFGGRDRD